MQGRETCFTVEFLSVEFLSSVMFAMNSMNNPGGGSRIFPEGRANPQVGAAGYEFIKFSPKLHEIKKNLVTVGGGGGGACRGRPPWIGH